MKLNAKTLIAFIQSVLYTLVNAIYSCACIHNNENLIADSDKEFDEVASSYNQLYICVGDLIGKKVRYWYGVTCTRWKRNFLSCAAQVRTLLSVLLLTYLYFAKGVSASSLVSFYRYAPGRVVTFNSLVANLFERVLLVKDFNINQISGNHFKVVAVFLFLKINRLKSC
ncbi:hypothetical protein [Photobacterium minamisatsumaniensis]|uniref:hypothetical protein n=1 Tax=Photobacterium minamisatsumaniensis TaxID=2910233 RepID=UPI003D0E043A